MRIKDAMNTSTKHWFEQVMDIALLEYERRGRSYRIEDNLHHFRPSMIHQCPRAIWYARKGYEPKEASVQGYRRMMMGTLIHEFIDRIIKPTKHYSSSEETVTLEEEDIIVVGHYDMIVKNPVGEYELIEVKSYGEPKANSKYKLDLPKPEHVGQWNFYSYLTSINDNVPDTDKGFIFYMNKNTQEYKIYNQTRNWGVINKLLAKMDNIQRYLDNDLLYPYQPDENHNWCDFRSQCESDYFIRGE